MITFEINAKPFGKERPRFGRGTVYTAPKTSAHEIMIGNLAKTAMRGKKIITGPVWATIRVVEKVPASWPQWKKEAALQGLIAHTAKPDLDNMVKLILDSINNIIYVDDSQVMRLELDKQFSNVNCTTVFISHGEGVPSNVKTLKEYKQLIGE